MMSKPIGVRATHPEYSRMSAKWKRCRDAAEGESAVHAATTAYLSKLGEELDADYKARLKRTGYFNATWRTIAGLRGMLFRKPAVLEAPAGINGYLDDVDMAGTPLQSFAQDIVAEALTVGRVGVMVDYPTQPVPGGTVAEAEIMGMRPSLQKYPAESIINWRSSRIANAHVLSMVVLTFEFALPGDEFSHATETRYRVLDLFNGAYRQRVFRIDAKGEDEQVGEDIFPLMSNAPMNYIPFVFVGVDDVGPDVDEPPLIDLVDMNLKHYGVTADYEHACHFSGLPTLFISGYQTDTNSPKIYIGGASANCLPDPQAKAYFVETSGNFEALRANLEDKKAMMSVLGARMLESQKSAVESAETMKQRSGGETSLLAGMAQTVSLGMTQALQWFADWAGAAGEVKYDLNKEFSPVGMTAQDLSALVTAWQSGAISHAVLFDNLQRAEVIDHDVTFEEEQARIGDAAPVMAQGAV
jgi:hypothetical protein